MDSGELRMKMTPTMRIRFVKRLVPGNIGDMFSRFILQQQWEEVDEGLVGRLKPLATEWRDVPVEDE